MNPNSLILGTTFALFAAESLFHYQIGVWQEDGPVQFPKIVMPPAGDLVAMAAVSLVFAGLTVLVLNKLGAVKKSAESTSGNRYAVAVIAPNENGVDGTVHFTDTGSSLVIDYDITGLTDGEHGFHIHEYGDLTEGCESACAHFNPDGTTHGGLDSEVRHLGDLGNITSKSGRAKGRLSTPTLSLNPRKRDCVVGRMIIVHADRDDLGLGGDAESLKTGNAGKRLGCGVIGMMEPPKKS